MNLFFQNLRIMLICFCKCYKEGHYCCNMNIRYCATEPEAWFLGRFIEPMWTAKSAARGFRGENLKKGTKYVTVSKIQECIGGTHFFEELRATRRRRPGDR